MEFRLLGALEAGSGGTVVDLGPPKQRALLAILLLHLGEIVSIDRLIDLLWGEEAPRTAVHSIQIYVSELRKALEPLAGTRLIHTRPPGYQLDTPPESVDARQFEALIQEGTTRLDDGDKTGAAAALRAALQLWRGPALSDFAYEEFAQPYVRRLHDIHLDAIEALAGAELDSGQSTGVVPLLEAAIREDPLRERSRELLMLALYRSGRHAEALRSYDRLRELLVEELGLEPSPALQQLRDRVLLHDPALLLPGRSEPQPRVTRNPYKGLQAFGETDAADFFGREALVDRLLDRLAAGGRMVALVGPSGSGKSSVVAAGLIPRLRAGAIAGSEEWLIAHLSPGPDPAREVEAVVARATGTVRRRSRSQDGGPPAGLWLPTMPEGTRLILVIDPFEQLFATTEESRRAQFLRTLASALRDPESPLVVVLTLRADFYDRPLQHAEFSDVFVPGVVNVLPMTARELEAAVSEPAERVGVTVDPALMAELVAETVEWPGSLPLLQYGLTELFEGRREPVLTLAGYNALGGLRGILSRRAEGVFLGLSPDEQRIATQLFLRLVRLVSRTADSQRRVTLSELTDLGIDSVGLSSVLAAFGGHRLLTFDNDPVTGEATVEMAHEALLTEWDRFAGWIDRFRAGLRRRDALLAAVEEWDLSGKNPDYLLTGSRLAEFEAWSQEGSLQLTAREREFLEAGQQRHEAEVAADTARTEDHRRLERRARTWLIGLAAAVTALVGGLVYWLVAAPIAPGTVAIMWTSDDLLGNVVTSGFDRAVTEFGLVGKRFTFAELVAGVADELPEDATDAEWGAALTAAQEAGVRQEAAAGAGLVIVNSMYVDDLDRIARDYPDIHFAIGDQVGSEPNVAYLTLRQSEASFLAGAAAALKTRSGTIGYIGGTDLSRLWGFEAGYEAGARAVDPDIVILKEYLSVGTLAGFVDVTAATMTALDMYAKGADIVFQAAGAAGVGVFEGATRFSAEHNRQVWAIGVDTDQYVTVIDLPGAVNARQWQQHILTSVLKGIDATVYQVVADFANDTFTPGAWNWGLAEGGVDISYSGGFIDDFRPTIEDLRAEIISGAITVPCVPGDRLDEAPAAGIDPSHCNQ